LDSRFKKAIIALNMIFARGALTGTDVDVSVRDEDEGAKANEGHVTTSKDDGVKGSLVSSDKYVII
jgi:hypothetical protein